MKSHEQGCRRQFGFRNRLQAWSLTGHDSATAPSSTHPSWSNKWLGREDAVENRPFGLDPEHRKFRFSLPGCEFPALRGDRGQRSGELGLCLGELPGPGVGDRGEQQVDRVGVGKFGRLRQVGEPLGGATGPDPDGGTDSSALCR